MGSRHSAPSRLQGRGNRSTSLAWPFPAQRRCSKGRNDGLGIGFALYGFRCSSFVGQPSIWLDDLYVNEDWRSQGAGAVLMDHLAQIAKENDCTHLAWNADARNIRGLDFYYRLGAEIMEQHGNRCFLRWVPWSAA
jgi:GNAT superfamily N-acetyltransferase